MFGEDDLPYCRRLEAAGYETMTIDHGYCGSLYVTNPNGLNLEFTVDHPRANESRPSAP